MKVFSIFGQYMLHSVKTNQTKRNTPFLPFSSLSTQILWHHTKYILAILPQPYRSLIAANRNKSEVTK